MVILLMLCGFGAGILSMVFSYKSHGDAKFAFGLLSAIILIVTILSVTGQDAIKLKLEQRQPASVAPSTTVE